MESQDRPVYRSGLGWQLGMSSYWFATSFKWYILLLVILPGQVEKIVPGGEKGTYWGLVFMVGAIWAMIGPSLFGFISDGLNLRGGKRGVFLAVGASLTVIALSVLSSVTEIWQIVLGYLLLQLADDVGTGPYSALVPEIIPEDQRGFASGVMGALNLFGQLAVGIFALVVGGNAQLIFLAIGILNVTCALITILTIRGIAPLFPISQAKKKLTLMSFARSWAEPWKNSDFRWVWFTRFLNALGFYLVVTYLKFYLGDVVRDYSLFGIVTFNSSSMATNVLALALSSVGAVGAVWAGRQADRLGRKRVIYLSGFIMFFALVPAALVSNYSMIFIFAAVFAVGYGAYQSADWALVSDVLPNTESLGNDMGVWQMSISSVQILAGAAGIAVDTVNRIAPGWGYKFAFLLASVAFLTSTTLIHRVKGSR